MACEQAPTSYESRQSRKKPSPIAAREEPHDDTQDEFARRDRSTAIRRIADPSRGQLRVVKAAGFRLGADRREAVDRRRQDIEERRVDGDGPGRQGPTAPQGSARATAGVGLVATARRPGLARAAAPRRRRRWPGARWPGRTAARPAVTQLAPHDREALVVDGRGGSPQPHQNAGVAALVASSARAGIRIGLDGREAAARQVVADRARRASPRGPGRGPPAVVAMQVMTAGSGASGSCG